MATKIVLPESAWYGDENLTLIFPDWFRVKTFHMKGWDAPKMGENEIRAALRRPIGTRPLSELARGRKEVAILFDDLTRPTKAFQLVPFVLEELFTGGIAKESIRFICALGGHRALSQMEFRRKLGDAIVEKFPVYNHNPYENCEPLGTTSRGTPVSINAEVMRCDLKIGIGCIVPHSSRGFGGGGKIVCPGVASAETIKFNHRIVAGRGKPEEGYPHGRVHPSIGLGKYDDNVMRFDIEEITRMAGLDFIVNPVLNLKRDPVRLFAGDPIEAHKAGVEMGKTEYLTEKAEGFQVVIMNAYAKSSEAHVALVLGSRLLTKSKGDLVLIAQNPEGQIVHYLSGVFGKFIGGVNWGPHFHPPGVRNLHILSPYPDPVSARLLADPDRLKWYKCWDDLLAVLVHDYPAPGPIDVAVYPDATVQYFLDQ